MRGTAVTSACWEEKGRLGALLDGTGHNGSTVRPLDGGALTRWGARTPARGPATASGLAAPTFRLARSVTVAATLRKEERAQTSEERERAEQEMS